MKKNLWPFYAESLRKFGEAIINLFIFLPYFFSVSVLLKTLFYSWKNLQNKKNTAGFSFSEWSSRFSFNLISRSIGFIMRICIISFYFVFQTLFMIILPFFTLGFFLVIPIIFLVSRYKKSADEQKELLKKMFLSKHLLKEENLINAENWFEKYYLSHIEKKDWWKLSNLLSFPPLARDWAVGFTPTLDQYTTDLATPSYLHHINNIIGREKEIAEIEQILSKNFEANVVIVGEEGVGKHTIIDALAKKIYLGKTNISLMYKRILKINMEKMINEINFFEELLKEAENAGNIILFIDNFEKYLTLGISLEKYAKSDKLQLIGVTTPFFYQKYIFPDEKINRLFSKVDVFEVEKKDALNIMLEKFSDLESYHKVIIPYETLSEAIEKSEFYLTYIPFPEKAVDLLDTACVYVKQKASKKNNLITPTVMLEDIDHVLTQKTHIPVTITTQMKEKLLKIEKYLSEEIFEQEEAINKLSSTLRRSFLLIGKRKKPLATFLFLGPTGVGKTATAKAVASVFFSRKDLIRFDMSNFQSKYDIPKLIGDSNLGDPGLLSSSIREKPYGVLLLDEIEKADNDLLNIFLTVIDEGYFTDGYGKRVDCKNLVIIATSNAPSIEKFSPEFINRFDDVITYNHLSQKSLKLITKKILDDLSKEIYQLYKVKIDIKENTIDTLIEKGYDKKYGARNMERVIRDEIEDKIAKQILEEKAKAGDTISL